jgi:hypothetical protein
LLFERELFATNNIFTAPRCFLRANKNEKPHHCCDGFQNYKILMAWIAKSFNSALMFFWS